MSLTGRQEDSVIEVKTKRFNLDKFIHTFISSFYSSVLP